MPYNLAAMLLTNAYVSIQEIKSITWIKSSQQIADSLTKHGTNSLPLIEVLQKGQF